MTSCDARVNVLVPALICVKEVSYDGLIWTDNIDVLPGMDVYFRVIATNTGSAPLYSVSLSDVLPNGFGSVQIVSGATCGVAGNTVTCSNLGPLDPAMSAEAVYRAVVDATNPPIETLVNTANLVGTSGNAGNPGAAVATACSASVDLLSPCLTCVKEVSGDGVNYGPTYDGQAGDRVYFRVVVSNCGDSALSDIELVDILPDGLVNAFTADGLCGVAGNTITCNLAALSAGASQDFLFEADIDANAEGTMVNTVQITAAPIVAGNTGDPLVTDCSAVVETGPLTIPTLSEWGMILLGILLALSLILHLNLRFRS